MKTDAEYIALAEQAYEVQDRVNAEIREGWPKWGTAVVKQTMVQKIIDRELTGKWEYLLSSSLGLSIPTRIVITEYVGA